MSRLEQFYLKAVDLDASERSAVIEQARAEDAVLAAELAALLSIDATGTVFEPLVRLIDDDDEPMLAAGDRVGRWTIARRIGIGASGEVYEVTSDRPPRSAALKLLHTRAPRGQVRRRFEREAEVLGMLDHPGIASIYRFDIAEGGPAHGLAYIVMSLVRGRTLGQWVREESPEVERLVEVIAEAADAVHFANLRGVVHRDLKPSNIMIDDAGRVRVIDFGVARLEEGDASETITGQMVGTPAYMAPEQRVLSGGAVDLRVDVYALGAVLYEALTGRSPTLPGGAVKDAGRMRFERPGHAPEPAHRIRRGLDRQLSDVLTTALEPAPDQRYPSCDALAVDLRRAMAGLPSYHRPPSALRRGQLFMRRNPLLTVFGIGAMVAILGGVSVSLWQRADAVAARGVAEDRFDVLREFSRWVIFDLDDQLAAMPGTTAMRADLVEKATNALAAMDPAPEDDALAVELAEAHLRLYRVTGSQFARSVGDASVSSPNIRRATELLEPRLARLDAHGRLLYADAANERAIHSDLEAPVYRVDAPALLESAYEIANELRAQPGTDADLIATQSLIWFGRFSFNDGDTETGLGYARRALAELEARHDDPQVNTATKAAFALARFWLGYGLFEVQDPACLPLLDKAHAQFESLVEAGEGRWWANLRSAESNATRAHFLYGDPSEGLDLARLTTRHLDDDIAIDEDNSVAFRMAEIYHGWAAQSILSIVRQARDRDQGPLANEAQLLDTARVSINRALDFHHQRKNRGWLRAWEERYEVEILRTRKELNALNDE
jgi:predicted Ser/Thr protein kinase